MRKAIFSFILLCATLASAQEISVSSFKMLENDLTANTTGTMEHDQNGETAALIKVVTSEQGFVFDGGMVGIVKTRQEVGEVWVYVPHGIKRITVKHPTLGVLRDYYFPIPIEKARTYEMTLSTGRVETIVTRNVNKQFVVFNVRPAHAIVELGDEMLTVDSEGYAEKGVPYGTYNYRVSCANYHTEAGQVTVTKEGKAEVNVTLRPNFGWIAFDGAEELHGAHIYIDNERVGQLPMVAEGGKEGVHQVRIVKPLYKPLTQQVTVREGDTVALDVKMVPNFAKVTIISADEQGEIWIDGHKKGTGRWTGGLETGEYKVEVRRESYRTVSDVLYVQDLSERTFRLGSPKPIYTTVEISSRPSKTTVYIDGKRMGETPLIASEVLVGSHRVTFKRDGYTTVEKTVELKENVENTLSAELVKGEDATEATAVATTHAPSESRKPKGATWRCILGAGAGYSDYGLDYGAEMGVARNRLSLIASAKYFMMGEYATFVSYNDYISNGVSQRHSVELVRFSAKIGYTLPIGKYLKITPRAGLVFGPSVLKGAEYFSGEVAPGYQYPEASFVTGGYKVLDERLDYSELNSKLLNFARMQLGAVGGLRLELTTANSRLGMHVTPEYVMNEGFTLNAGVVVRF